MSTPGASQADRVKMNNLAAAIYMMAQGIPFIHAGEEMLRSKPKGDGSFEENSYASGDAVNALKWDTLTQPACMDTLHYYKGLIAFRKAHPALRLTTSAEVSTCLSRVTDTPANVVAVELRADEHLYLVFNASTTGQTLPLPQGSWKVCIHGQTAGTETLRTVSGSICVDAISATVLVKE